MTYSKLKHPQRRMNLYTSNVSLISHCCLQVAIGVLGMGRGRAVCEKVLVWPGRAGGCPLAKSLLRDGSE